MDANVRHQRVWRLLQGALSKYIEGKFNFDHERYEPEGPFLVISNHVTNWDPLLLAICFPKKPVYFVASEHLFRMGWKSKAINYLVAPIPRRKGTNGAATAMDCLRKIRAGHSVCIFGEGETTWNGRSKEVFPATGTLAKLSGATLITYRLEGGYLTAPRWGNGVRRGKMRGRIVNTYSPEVLKKMTPLEIEAAMNADIYENAWERQKREPVKYRGKRLAEGIEVSAFICPNCKKIGSVAGSGNTVACPCGLKMNVTEYGTFDPPVPFENMEQWDDWQMDVLRNGEFEHGDVMFSDGTAALLLLTTDHGEMPVTSGGLSMSEDALVVGERRFPLGEISDMALIQRRRLAFMHGENYYELQTPKPTCLRKYHAVWENIRAKSKAK